MLNNAYMIERCEHLPYVRPVNFDCHYGQVICLTWLGSLSGVRLSPMMSSTT